MKGHFSALAAGAAAALLIGALTTGQAQATNTGQPHEARIILGTGVAIAQQWGWQPIGMVGGGAGSVDTAGSGVEIDTRDYPAGAIVRVRHNAGDQNGATGGCVRFYDATAGRPVAGSQTCLAVPASNPGAYEYSRFASGPLRLPAAAHVYVVQIVGDNLDRGPYVTRSELVINRTE